ncbi:MULTISPECIES: ATP-binding cassette domain-containing protein [Streptomyces]|uniref:ATP-binding cassette domain-containing protein n=1 Tax=Streptomyces TaxID=1883 RepID=UPI00099D553C|nr:MULTISPECIES: ATP-binding cassette domain-containing protein [unclassified Streptomyces]
MTTTTAARAAQTTTDTAVSFQNVTKSYGTVRAVDGLSLALHPGETVALLGPNGAGKSSTLDLLLGLRPADSGSVRLFGTTPREAVAAGRVGAMLQSGGLMEDVTVREIVALGCALHPRPYPVEEVLTRAGVADIAARKVNKLSGGQEQRVRFALATAGHCDLIVLDEAEAVRKVLRGERVIDPTLAAAALAEGANPLTDREREVLREAETGATNSELAARLHLSQGTVRNYLSTAIQKLAARNRAEAVRTAREKGWL